MICVLNSPKSSVTGLASGNTSCTNLRVRNVSASTIWACHHARCKQLDIVSHELRHYTFSYALHDNASLLGNGGSRFESGGSLRVLAFDASSTRQHRLQSTQSEVVMRLSRQLLKTEVEEWYDLARQYFRRSKAFREEHDLSNELLIRTSHCYASEQLLEIVWQIGSACIPGIHCCGSPSSASE